jgi:hypothetical protein
MDNEEDRGFTLDESARQLYQQLEGIDETLRVDVSMKLESELMQFLQQEEKERDHCRLLIAQAVCLFVDILAETTVADLEKGDAHKVRVLVNTLKKIAEFAGPERKISCRYRGQVAIAGGESSAAANPEAYDYELSLGDVLLDYQVAQKVAEREPFKGRALAARLMHAFTIMSGMRIFNFNINVKDGAEEDGAGRYAAAVAALVRFYRATAGDDSFFVRDEYDQPNINLTLLAATNQVRPGSLQELVDQIKPLMLGPEPAPELSRFTTVYDAIRASRRYRQQLRKMAIEVNSMHQLMRNSRPSPKWTAEAVQVSRLVLAKYGSDPKKASEIISSISEEGYLNVRGNVMGKRLAQATEFLDLAAANANQESLENEALRNIEAGLQNIPDEVYGELDINDNELSTVDGQGRKTKWSLHRKIFGLVSYFKQRALTKSKVRDINKRSVQFDAMDYSVIARNCKVTDRQAAHLVELLKECFSDSGRFRRGSFEKNIPEFLKYEANVFEFLWYYLKGLRLKDDRLAFLNSIQLLVSQLRQPGQALNILLSDIFNPTSIGRFSDRNGLILASILLRNYNKEGSSNIELTPEEVLYVRIGLNKEMVQVGQDFFKRNQEQVIQKVKRITELMLRLSVEKAHEEEQMQLRFLLNLLREVVVFCSLIGGEISRATVKGIVQEFGNPGSAFYRTIADKNQISQGLKLLQVAARGLKRFNDPLSLKMLAIIAGMEREFAALYDNPVHRVTVKKVMARVVEPDG